jgi:hypothetical protein
MAVYWKEEETCRWRFLSLYAVYPLDEVGPQRRSAGTAPSEGSTYGIITLSSVGRTV